MLCKIAMMITLRYTRQALSHGLHVTAEIELAAVREPLQNKSLFVVILMFWLGAKLPKEGLNTICLRSKQISYASFGRHSRAARGDKHSSQLISNLQLRHGSASTKVY